MIAFSLGQSVLRRTHPVALHIVLWLVYLLYRQHFLDKMNRQHQFFQLSVMLSIPSNGRATLLPSSGDSIYLLSYLRLDLPIAA